MSATPRPPTPSDQASRRASVVRPDPGAPRRANAPPGGSAATRARSACEGVSRPRTGQGGSPEVAPGARPAAFRSALPSSSTLGQRASADSSVARAATFASARRASYPSSSPRRASASLNVAPSAYTSARTVSFSPVKSSGAAYRGVSPRATAPPSRQGAARPRSTSVPRRSSPTMMLAGFTSPWRRPARCTTVSWSHALAIEATHPSLDAAAAPSACSTSSRLRPSTSSRTM